MAIPGSDFLGSLEDLFDEAGSYSRVAKIEFIHLRGILIGFLTSCSRMTAAKARATCNLKFLDGTEPKTILALPPGKIRINDETRAHLETSSTSIEFIEILRVLISKQVSPRRSPRRPSPKSKEANNNSTGSPKSKAQRRSEGVTLKEKKQLVRIKLRLDTDAGQQQTPTTPMDLDSQPSCNASKEALEPAQDNLNDSEMEDSPPSSPDSQGDIQMEDVAAAKVQNTSEKGTTHGNFNTAVQHRPGCRDIAAEIQTIDASRFEENRQRLLDLIARMDAPATPEEIEAALKRLEFAFSKIEKEKAFMPVDTWKLYEEMLIQAANEGWFEKPLAERMYKVGRIFYLSEEEAVIESGDWNRLRAAARMWAIIVEMTAPPQEPVDQEAMNKWLVEKLGDISFLERLFACKERIASIKGPGEK
ncbi:hypothetical protein FALBO_8559 [Fusarium albosuccineum]|uniref:Uncharacterized protein n=1 Tax=Fusarium albosuccineum TaxID=1237068 RepID=A0A8H4LAP1_9HYPO|nr:hypothetical protein FALBO_8559 [Fusarium albosuccineum]